MKALNMFCFYRIERGRDSICDLTSQLWLNSWEI